MAWDMRWMAIGIASLVSVAGCGDDSDGVTAGADVPDERVEVYVPLAEPIVVFDDHTLLAASAEDVGVYRSDDRGASWDEMDLPARPTGSASLRGLSVRNDDVVVVTAFDRGERDHYVWISDDAREWHGGRLETGLDSSDSYDLDVLVLGDLVSAVVVGETTGESDDVVVLHSRDGGATWEQADLPGVPEEADSRVRSAVLRQVDDDLSLEVVYYSRAGDRRDEDRTVRFRSADAETWELCAEGDVDAGPCGPYEVEVPENQRAGSLWVGGRRASFDQGETWQPVTVTGGPADAETFDRLGGLVELDEGGWLASGTAADVGDISWGLILRSDDGVRWENLLDPDPCEGDPRSNGRHNSSTTSPVAFGDGWLMSYSCSGLLDHLWTRYYLFDADGSEATVLADGSYGPPIILDDGTVIAPERDPSDDETVVALVHLES